MKSIFALLAAVCAFTVFAPASVQAQVRFGINIESGGGYRGGHCNTGGYAQRHYSGGHHYSPRYTNECRSVYPVRRTSHRRYASYPSYSRSRSYATPRYDAPRGCQPNYGGGYYGPRH